MRSLLPASVPVLLLVCLAVDGLSAPLRPASPPNIIVVLTDDQGWNSLSCYGNRFLETPHLDRLAAEGMRFTSAYATPQCTPTRAAFLTGQHTARNRMWHVIPPYDFPWAWLREPEYTHNLPRETMTVAKALQAAGYTTGIIGKWHLTHNEDGNYELLRPAAARHYGFDYAPTNWVARLAGAEPGDKAVNWITDRAIEFMRAPRDGPFFLFVSHHTVHRKVIAPAELVAKHRARGAPEAGQHNATFLAALEHLDASVGRLLAALDEARMATNTLVIFTSDNGGEDAFFDQAPLRGGKGTAYEGGIRVPLLVRWPGVVRPGAVCDTPVTVMDFYPTFLEAAGARPPRGHTLDGQSLLSLLRESGRWSRDTLYWYLPLYDLNWGATPSAVIRQGDWKLIEYFGDYVPVGEAENVRRDEYQLGRRLELYNLREDLGETHNRIFEERRVAARLERELHRWLRGLNAPVPQRNPNFDSARALLRGDGKDE